MEEQAEQCQGDLTVKVDFRYTFFIAHGEEIADLRVYLSMT